MSPLSTAAHAAVAAAPTLSGARLFAGSPGASAPVGFGGVVSVSLALLAVLAAIFAVAWLARRMRGFGNRVGNALEVLADVPLGPKERAVLIRLGAEQILVGVAPGRVSALHVLREPVEISRGATAAAPSAPDTRPSFRALLKRSLGK
jgi:flagellar protein FliO/FliZ